MTTFLPGTLNPAVLAPPAVDAHHHGTLTYALRLGSLPILAGRKRKRATVVRSDDRPVGAPPPSAASNVTVDNLNDHVPFFDRPSARHAPTVRRR